MLELFGIPPQVLPEIRSCAEVYGTTKGMDALPDGIPVSGMAGDQQAALFGQACFRPGESKCTYGTGSFLLMNTGPAPVVVEARAPDHGGLAARGRGDLRARGLELRRRRGGAVAPRRAAGDQEVAQVEKLARSVADTGEVVFVPGAGRASARRTGGPRRAGS